MGSTFAGSVLGVETVDQSIAVKGDDRRDEIDRIVVIVDERDDRIVPPINDSDRGGRGAKINSESHGTHPSV